MPKSIVEMVIKKVDRITKDPSEAGQNATLAIAAINGGIRSDAWRNYMMQFVEKNPPGHAVDPAQLERLMGTDNTLGDPEMDKRRAYIVANAVCAATTPQTTGFGIDGIDDGLQNVAPAVLRARLPGVRYGKLNGYKPKVVARKKAPKRTKPA